LSNRPVLVLASANPDKVGELIDLLGDRFEVQPRPADLAETIEDEPTLTGNALKKAIEVAEFTGQIALADDTGLFVDALDGRPGVHTARFAGPDATYEDNVEKLLASLDGSPEDQRAATFRTVVALIRPDGTGLTAEGEVAGVITATRRGANGFGYDPVFQPTEGSGATFGEMSADDKAELSHRARAMASLETALGQVDLSEFG